MIETIDDQTIMCRSRPYLHACDHGLALKLEDGAVNGQGLGGREAELLRRTQCHLFHHHTVTTPKNIPC
jgi:hypothetical protein